MSVFQKVRAVQRGPSGGTKEDPSATKPDFTKQTSGVLPLCVHRPLIVLARAVMLIQTGISTLSTTIQDCSWVQLSIQSFQALSNSFSAQVAPKTVGMLF